MNDTTAYEAAFPNRKLTGIDQRIAGVIAELHALADEMDSAFRVSAEVRVAEAVSPSEEVEGLKPFSNERPSAVASDGETAEVCAECGKGEEALCDCAPDLHRGDGPFPVHWGGFNCLYGHPFKPVEAAPVEPLEGEWRRAEHQYWRDDPTGWERTTEGYTSYGTEVVWTHPKRGSQVVSLGIERAIAAHFAMEQFYLLKARAERAEERASTAERRLEGHENLAAAAIRERDEARGEVERLQAALEEALLWWRVNGLGGRLNCYCDSDWARENNPCGVCRYERCEAVLKSSAEARVSTPVREERGE